MYKSIFISLLLIITSTVFAQEKKNITASRINTPPKIDGILNDKIWESVAIATDFNMFEPGNEGIINDNYQTEVKIAYDDKAVYIAAAMFDPNPDQIQSQLSQRDDVFVQADLFYVALNTFNDGINETRFYVTSAGSIGDSKSSQNGNDFNYNVVFNCKIFKDENGKFDVSDAGTMINFLKSLNA